MMSMTILVLVCIWHAIIPQIAADWGLELAHTSDVIVLAVLGSVFVTSHVAFVHWIRKRVSDAARLCCSHTNTFFYISRSVSSY